MHEYVMYTYELVEQFPKEEVYGSRSQLTRAALSVMLNYLEGYARRRYKVRLNQYETAYGSLVESRYIHYFAHQKGWINKDQFDRVYSMVEEMAAMLWSELDSTEDSIEKGFDKTNKFK